MANSQQKADDDVQSISDLREIRKNLTPSQKKALQALLYYKAFSSSTARQKKDIAEYSELAFSSITYGINKSISSRLIIKTIDNLFYLTSNGVTIAESLVLKGVEFTEDSLEANLFNPFGRKVLHLIEVGLTVNTIAEKIGYYVEDLILEQNEERFSLQMKYCIHKVYQTLDVLAKFGIIKLRYHQRESSVTIDYIYKPALLHMLQHISIIIEFIPTLLIEDATHFSILHSLIDYKSNNEIIALFKEVTPFPEVFQGKVAYAERVAYWLNPIEELETKAEKWQNISLLEKGDKHYFMLKKKIEKKNCNQRMLNRPECPSCMFANKTLKTCGSPTCVYEENNSPTKEHPEATYVFDKKYWKLTIKHKKREKHLWVYKKEYNGSPIKPTISIITLYKIYKNYPNLEHGERSTLSKLKKVGLIVDEKDMNNPKLTDIGRKVIEELSTEKPEFFNFLTKK